jgi:hypothetical protein
MLAGLLFSGGIVMAAGLAMGAAGSADRTKVVGTNACAECHKQEAEALKGTHHFKTFREMPRDAAATKIAKAMGVRRVKAESVCLNCHFTVQEKGGSAEPISGISCESCHGPGQDWIKVHSGYSGKTAATETKPEAAARWKLAEAKGMIRPGSVYALAKNCYSCHVVPHEELVNKGGHLPGSAFDLVAWSQGEVRHNTWHSKGKDNVAASASRRRMLYLVGLGVELETALRAIGKASARKIYAFDMAARADRARKQLAAAAKSVPGVPEIGKLVEYGHAGGLKLNNESALTAAADGVAKVLVAISEKYDGSTMSGLDSFIPAPDKYKGQARAAAAVK